MSAMALGRSGFCSWAGGLCALAFVSCGELIPEPTPRKESTDTDRIEFGKIPAVVPTLPVRWKLADLEGRSIDAMIIGKSGDSITLIRMSDGKRFELPVLRLSEEDQKRVRSLPTKTAPSRHPSESSHYRMAQAKLDETDARIAELTSILNTSDSRIQIRSAHSEMERLLTQRVKLLEDLKELEKY